jgi:ribosomal protein S18 acetylase RimI-like enzyme
LCTEEMMLNTPGNCAIQIRDARPQEAARIALLLRSAYNEYQAVMPPYAWQAYLADIMNVRGRMADDDLIVAESDGKLVGTVTVFMDDQRSFDDGWPKGWAAIRLLGVAPKNRGCGIGRALMDECLSRCRVSGIKTIGLHTAEIMSAAKKMYERMGFTRAPEFDFHPMSGVVIMAYKLDIQSR